MDGRRRTARTFLCFAPLPAQWIDSASFLRTYGLAVGTGLFHNEVLHFQPLERMDSDPPDIGGFALVSVRQAVYSVLRSRSPQSFSPQSALRYSWLFFCKYFCIPLLLALPIYFTAWDYGRWFTVTSINFAMLAVSVNLPCREFTLQKKAADESATTMGALIIADLLWRFDHHLYPGVILGCPIIVCSIARLSEPAPVFSYIYCSLGYLFSYLSTWKKDD
jgi:hypothetical protein